MDLWLTQHMTKFVEPVLRFLPPTEGAFVREVREAFAAECLS